MQISKECFFAFLVSLGIASSTVAQEGSVEGGESSTNQEQCGGSSSSGSSSSDSGSGDGFQTAFEPGGQTEQECAPPTTETSNNTVTQTVASINNAITGARPGGIGTFRGTTPRSTPSGGSPGGTRPGGAGGRPSGGGSPSGSPSGGPGGTTPGGTSPGGLDDGSGGGGASADEEIGTDFSRWTLFFVNDYSEIDREETQLGGSYESDSNVIVFGGDYRVDPDLFVGLSVSYAYSDTVFGRGGGDSQLEGVVLGAHASRYWGGNFFSDALITVGHFALDISRNSLGSSYEADPNGTFWSGDISLGYDYSNERLRITPVAKLFYLRGKVDGYTEKVRASLVPLPQTVRTTEIASTLLDLSIQADYITLHDWGVLIPSARLAYQREFSGVDDLNGSVGANPFFTAVDKPDRNTLLARIGASAQFKRGFSAFITAETLIEHEYQDRESAVVGVRYELP